MKKIFTLILTTSFFLNGYSQILVEDFNYTAGQPLTDNGWTVTAANTTNPVSVTAPGLTFTGYAGSGIGNAATLTTTGQDVYREGSGSFSTGTVYASFMVNVASAQATGDYFFALLPTTSTTNYSARTYIRSSGTGFQVGLTKSNETINWGTTVYNFNQTYLFVVKYVFNAGTTMDDQLSLFVISGAIPATEPATPEVGPITSATTTDATNIARVALRQGTASSAAAVTVDGIRLGSGWGTTALPVNIVSFNATLSNNKVNVSWSTANEVNFGNFEIERSINGKDFIAVSRRLEAKGGATNNYSFVDEAPVAGVSYYRLKMNDKDGSFKYSAIEIVKTKTVGVSVYPNPVRSSITVQHEVAAKGAMIAVMDMSGKQAASITVQAGTVQTTISAAQLAPGSYMVVYTNNGVRQTKQFIKE
jgi:hypothetical protein